MSQPVSPVELATRKVPCPHCLVLAGRCCLSASGRDKSYSHAARFDAATQDGYLPLGPETP